MKTQTYSRPAQSGSTLLTVLAMIIVVSILLLAYMGMVVQRGRAIARSQNWNLCVPVAEAGIEEAMAHLNHTKGRNMATNGWDFIGANRYTNFYELGANSGQYSVVISNISPPVGETRGSIEVLGSLKVPGTGRSNEVRRSFRVNTLFRPGTDGIITQTKATIKNSAQADSYDSRIAPYDPRNPGDKTFIGNNSTQPSQVEISGDARVYGDIGTGAPGGVKIDKPAVVGDYDYASDNRNAGNIQPGHYSSGLEVPLSPVPSVPFTGGSPLPPRGGGNLLLPGGNFKVNGTLELQNNEVITVTGAATIWVTDTLVVKDNSKIVISPGSTLTVYVEKQFYTIGNAQINTGGNPKQFSYIGMSSNAEFYMSGNAASLTGTVYAPNAKMDLSGNAQFFGGGHVGELVLQGNSEFHFDEALRHQTGQPFVITSWHEL